MTFRATEAAEAITIMSESCPDMLLGAGSLLTTAQVDETLAAGARFIVTPGLDPDPVRYLKVKVMPTVSISLKNLNQYLFRPVICACDGSCMVTAELIDNQK